MRLHCCDLPTLVEGVARERKRERDPDAWISSVGPAGPDHGLELHSSARSRFGGFGSEAEVLPAGSADHPTPYPFRANTHQRTHRSRVQTRAGASAVKSSAPPWTIGGRPRRSTARYRIEVEAGARIPRAGHSECCEPASRTTVSVSGVSVAGRNRGPTRGPD
jgi:hypothetical protein